MKIPDRYQPEYKRLNKKLVPANIVILVLAVVAFIAQLFFPLISVTVSIPKGGLADVIDYVMEMSDEDASVSGTEGVSAVSYGRDLEYALTDSEAGADEDDDMTAEILDLIREYADQIPEISFTVSMTPFKMVTSLSDSAGESLANWVMGMLPSIDDIVAQISKIIDPLFSADTVEELLDSVKPTLLDYLHDELVMDDGDTTEEDWNELFVPMVDDMTGYFVDILNDLSNGEKDSARENFANLMDCYIDTSMEMNQRWAERNGEDYEYDESDQEEMDEMKDMMLQCYDIAVKYGYGSGSTFSLVNVLNALMDGSMMPELATVFGVDDYSDEDAAEFGENFSEMLAEMLVDMGVAEDEEAAAEMLDSISDMGGDINALVTEIVAGMLDELELDEMFSEIGISINTIMIAAFIILGAFPAALWLILAIAALRRIFSNNKKVGMWYVKLVSIWPCILFYILPVVAISLLPSLLGEFATLLGLINISYMSSGLVTGICYLALWAVSIFMCFPTKRKLRKLKKEIKNAPNTPYYGTAR